MYEINQGLSVPKVEGMSTGRSTLETMFINLISNLTRQMSLHSKSYKIKITNNIYSWAIK